MINNVVVVGKLGTDPKSVTSKNPEILNVGLACHEQYKDREGNKQTRTHWFRVALFGNQAEFCKNYCKKGDTVGIDGSLTYREWTDQQGFKRTAVEIKAKHIELVQSKHEPTYDDEPYDFNNEQQRLEGVK